MSTLLEIAASAVLIVILDWAAIWQVENAFAAFLKLRTSVPKRDPIRFGILLVIFLATVAILTSWFVNLAAGVAIGALVIYFWRLVTNAQRNPRPL